MGLAQQVVLAVMLDNDPPLITQQGFAVDATIGGGGRRCVFLLALPRCYPYVT
jgi:hypothetical protein